MLWNIIRDFFVQYVFGGIDSLGYEYSNCSLGSFVDNNLSYIIDGNGNTTSASTYVLFNPITKVEGDVDVLTTWNINFIDYNSDGLLIGMTIGDYLSTTFTIITLVIFFVIMCLLVRWCFRVMKGAFKW